MAVRRTPWKHQQRDAAAQQNFEIPLELLDAINGARHPCYFFQQGWQCKRGEKCIYRHDSEQQRRLPHVSCNRADDGTERLVIRPRSNVAWAAFFQEKGVVGKLQHGKMISEDCILYPMINMEEKMLRLAREPI